MVWIFRRQVILSLEALTPIDKMIGMGAQADPEMLKEEANIHYKTIGSISGRNSMTSRPTGMVRI